MRVIAGKCRSLNLITPKGNNTRPTQDRIKETLFNILMPDIDYAVFVDIFAGSGGIGIEALSRGAERAYFIDNSSEAIKCIEKNLEFTRMSQSAKVLKGDFEASLSMISENHVDIVFADPPYEMGLEDRLFRVLENKSYIDDETIIILEASINKDFSFEGFEIYKEKKYKTNKHLFIRRKND